MRSLAFLHEQPKEFADALVEEQPRPVAYSDDRQG
jgi:hypothetical protein